MTGLYPARSNSLKINIIIISYNTCSLVADCIDSIKAGVSLPEVDITVFDNNSSDNTFEYISQHYPDINIIKSDKNLGYAKAVNLSVAPMTAQIFLVSNSDVLFTPNSIKVLTDFLETHPHVGIIGPQQLFPGGKWQRSYGDIPGIWEGLKNLSGCTSLLNLLKMKTWGLLPIEQSIKPVGYVDGAVFAFRREAFDAISGFNDDFFFYSEEADFCYRLRKAGWEVMFVPEARVIHLRGSSSTKLEPANEKYSRMQANSKVLFVTKHFPAWHVGVYLKLQQLHFMKKYVLSRFLGLLTTGTTKRRLMSRTETFRRLMAVWTNQIIQFRQNGKESRHQ